MIILYSFFGFMLWNVLGLGVMAAIDAHYDGYVLAWFREFPLRAAPLLWFWFAWPIVAGAYCLDRCRS